MSTDSIGFMAPAELGELGPSRPIYTRRNEIIAPPNIKAELASLKRASVTGDISQILAQLNMSRSSLERAITSSVTAFPVRENLEAEAKILVPMDTPLRNMLPRSVGSGKASAWKQLTSLGGGFTCNTTVTGGGATSATQTLASTAGIQKGDQLFFSTANATRIVSSVTNSTTVVLTASVTTVADTVTKVNFQPDGAAASQSFFAESGAPAEHTSVYADKSATYKLLGALGSVTGFAAAAGATFQNQLAIEKRNILIAVMQNEENALLNGDSTITAAPYGDGSSALAFDGLRNLIATANGTPASQVQTSVGALTTSHMDAQIQRIYMQGGRNLYMILNPIEILSLVHLAEGSGSIIRVTASSATGATVLGVQVTGYVNPVTGEVIPIYADRYQQPGTIIYGSLYLPDNSPAADVQVLPQVQLPQLAPNVNIQGYTVQELAPAAASPMKYPFLVSVFEVLRMKSNLHFAISSGLTAV